MRFSPSRSLSSSQLSRRSIALGFAGLPLAALTSAQASVGPDLVRARTKVNAYADLLNLAAQMRSMWQRYTRLVNADRGPTGRGAMGLALFGIAGWIWRQNNRPGSDDAQATDDETANKRQP